MFSFWKRLSDVVERGPEIAGINGEILTKKVGGSLDDVRGCARQDILNC